MVGKVPELQKGERQVVRMETQSLLELLIIHSVYMMEASQRGACGGGKGERTNFSSDEWKRRTLRNLEGLIPYLC